MAKKSSYQNTIASSISNSGPVNNGNQINIVSLTNNLNNLLQYTNKSFNGGKIFPSVAKMQIKNVKININSSIVAARSKIRYELIRQIFKEVNSAIYTKSRWCNKQEFNDFVLKNIERNFSFFYYFEKNTEYIINKKIKGFKFTIKDKLADNLINVDNFIENHKTGSRVSISKDNTLENLYKLKDLIIKWQLIFKDHKNA